MTTLLHDIRYAIRMLLKQPGFTAVAVLALALGIGANTAIFSIVNAVLLRPLPYADPGQLVMVWMDYRVGGNKEDIHSWPAYVDYRDGNTTFASMAGYTNASLNLTGTGEPERILGASATASFWDVMRTPPLLGRVFTPEENTQGNDRVIVLSHGLWQRRFAAQRSIVGQEIEVDGAKRTVIGVMPPAFRFPEKNTDFWVPLAISPELQAQRAAYWLTIVGRLKPGVTVEQARPEMEAIAKRLETQFPESNANTGVNLVSLRDQTVGRVRPALYVLLGAVALVLLIACANVANLLLSRAAAREREFAIRSAVGAGRAQIVRQLLVESVVLGVVAAAVGVGLAIFGLDALKAMLPADMPRVDQIGVDARVLGFTLAVSMVTAVAFGLVPALQASKPKLSETLKEAGGRSGSGGVRSRQVRRLLVIAEVALAIMLLVGAGLLIKSFNRLQSVDLGFRTDRMLTVELQLPPSKYGDGNARRPFHAALLERLANLPGVEGAAATTSILLTNTPNSGYFNIEGRPTPRAGERIEVTIDSVSPNYHQLMGTPLLRGRAFTDADGPDAPRVVLINEAFARRFFAGEDPVGKRMNYGDNPDQTQNPWRTIVGVVADTRRNGFDREVRPESYIPLQQRPSGWTTYVIRTSSSQPTTLVSAVRSAVRQIDPDLPIFGIKTMDELMSETTAQRRLNTVLLGTFAGLALVLAAVGIFGVMNYSVTQRTQEIGIRLALGAQRGDVLKLVVGQGMMLALIGVAVGLFGAWALTRLLANMLYGVSATDPVVFVAVAGLLALVAVVACYLPALRASRVHPTVALREG
jgi:putative ABC transport system permease protein